MKLFNSRYTDNSISLSLLILRLTLGGLMVHAGYGKLTDFADMSTKFIDPFGIGMPATLGLLIFAEFFCAILVLLGLLTRLACIPLIIAMTAALHYGHDWKIFTEGMAPALLVGGFIALLIAGPGKYSLDKMIGK